MKIETKIVGCKTQATGVYISKSGQEETITRHGRNGAEAVNNLLKYIKGKYGKGVYWEIDGTPVRGVT